MNYTQMHRHLKELVNFNTRQVSIDENTLLVNCEFESHNYKILPGEKEYCCSIHDVHTSDPYNYENKTGIVNEILDVHDSEIKENRNFSYHIFTPSLAKSSEVILMFHGFNEKHWHKYLPWAKRLVKQTGKTVVLFPLAFHMNRAPHEWSDPRLMFKVSELRKKIFPDILSSTLSNVAISTRLQSKPQRFFWSGLQTYYDVIQLVDQIRAGKHSVIEANATIDIFAYSIGSLFSQILLMNNPKGYFSGTKLFIFCGGAVFNRMSAVSKFILDSEANVALYSYVIEHLESHLKNDRRLNHYLSKDHPEGINFLSMINYQSMRKVREEKFNRLAPRIMAIALEKDLVVPAYEVINTLKGINRDIPIRVVNKDFPYDYKHEDPFPIIPAIEDKVNDCFDEIFNLAATFLK